MMISEAVQAAADLLRKSNSVVAFTGAGISTPSGIPDFRSPHSGLWNDVDPMAVASIHGFRQNPEAFYTWIYPLARLTINARPNPAHEALVYLETLGKLNAVITQNIDMLHTRAGNKVVYELHGHMREATCVHCFAVYPAESLITQFLNDRRVPRCPSCGSVLKPNVILFGEQLPIRQLLAAQDAARKADVFLVVGSSLEVAPASDIPVLAKRHGAQIIIVNLEPTPLDPLAHIVIRGDAAEVLPQITAHIKARV
ncbi:MAG: NAD-dependent deacylase [Chloroflexi bacterium]|nr:NAD-dependent deacylase [Chloroflexota bacterium]